MKTYLCDMQKLLKKYKNVQSGLRSNTQLMANVELNVIDNQINILRI